MDMSYWLRRLFTGDTKVRIGPVAADSPAPEVSPKERRRRRNKTKAQRHARRVMRQNLKH